MSTVQRVSELSKPSKNLSVISEDNTIYIYIYILYIYIYISVFYGTEILPTDRNLGVLCGVMMKTQ